MRHSKFALRSVLSTCLISVLCAHAYAESPSPYVELYKDQMNGVSVSGKNQNGLPPSIRVSTEQRIISNQVTTQGSQNGAKKLPVNAVNAPEMRATAPTFPAAKPKFPAAQPKFPTARSQKVAVRQSSQPNATRASMASMPIATLAAGQVPIPNVSISDISFVPTVIIPVSRYDSNEQLDVSLLDDFINDLSPNARHYPPTFATASEKYHSTKKLEQLELWLRPYAERPDASYDVLLRAAKLNGMARNLDFGSDFAVRASTYVARALEQQPNSQEANFLYGMMLSEGGGFKEGKKYLDKAVGMGYVEAEQSLAQADLLRDRKGAALDRLRRLLNQDPSNATLQRQIKIIEDGKYYIWDLSK